MSNQNIITEWNFRRPVTQREDFCTACGKYKSEIERWNECVCKEKVIQTTWLSTKTDKKYIIDEWLGIVSQSEKRKPVLSSSNFSNAPSSRYNFGFAYTLSADVSDLSKWG